MNNNIKQIGKYEKAEWCLVDADGVFTYENQSYKINEDFKDYKVYNKYNEVEDYTNEAFMDKVLSVTLTDKTISFFNQNFKLIPNNEIKKM